MQNIIVNESTLLISQLFSPFKRRHLELLSIPVAPKCRVCRARFSHITLIEGTPVYWGDGAKYAGTLLEEGSRQIVFYITLGRLEKSKVE